MAELPGTQPFPKLPITAVKVTGASDMLEARKRPDGSTSRWPSGTTQLSLAALLAQAQDFSDPDFLFIDAHNIHTILDNLCAG
jgi:hypothetical protein